MLPKPSLTLVLDIDERLNSEDLKLEINRCYSYVAPTLIRPHSAPQEDESIASAENTNDSSVAHVSAQENIMRFLIKMGAHSYLSNTDEKSKEMWNEVMRKWLHNTLTKVSNNMRIFNNRQVQESRDELQFSWIDLEFENGKLNVLLHCDTACGINVDDALCAIESIRQKYNDGSFAKEPTQETAEDNSAVVRVWTPTKASWNAQYVIGEEEKAKREEAEEKERLAKEAEAKAARLAKEAEAEEAFLESPELLAEEAQDNEGALGNTGAEDSEGTSDTDKNDAASKIEIESDGGGEDIDALYALKEADFHVSYDTCTVEYADETTQDFSL